MLVKFLLPVFLFAARAYAQDPSAEGAAVPAPSGDAGGHAEAPAASAESHADAAAPSADAGAAGASTEIGVTPNEPSGKTIAKVGDKIKIQWDADATWTNMTIQLKTGANQVMKGLTVVAEGVDATKANEYEWTVPDVNPYSQIYFFEFTNNGPNLQPATWTTRFTIASPKGDTTPPTETEKVGASLVGWGNGALATGAPVVGAGAVGASAPAASATPTGPARLASAEPSASTSAKPDAAIAAGVSAASSSTEKASTTAAKPSASTTAATSSAGRVVPGLALLVAAAAFFA